MRAVPRLCELHEKTSVRVVGECQLARWEQNIQNRTYIAIRIRKHYNKNTWFKKSNKSIQNIHNDKKRNPKNMKECDKRRSHKSRKLHMFYISSNNVRHPVTKLFTTLHPTTPHSTSLNFSTLDFLPFKLHPAALRYPLIWLNPI